MRTQWRHVAEQQQHQVMAAAQQQQPEAEVLSVTMP